MKIKQDQVERVCRLVLETLKEKKAIKLKVPERQVFERMVKAFTNNLAQEAEIDQKANEILNKTLENTSGEMGGTGLSGSTPGGSIIDKQKMFLMIKRKLAKDKGFIL